MRLGVFAKTFPGTTPQDTLSACRQAGFAAAQYNMACSGLGALPQSVSAVEADAVATAAARTGVAIAALSATYNMTDPVPERREAGRRSFAVLASQARRMGTGLLTVCSGSLDAHDQWRHHPGNAGAEAWADMLSEFALLLDVAETHGILIGVEPEPANVVSSARKAEELLKTFPGSRLRMVLDPANLLEGVAATDRAAVIDEAFDLLGDTVALAHAKHRDESGKVVPAGQGIVDWPHFLKGLRAAGFDGDLVAHGITPAEAPQVAAFLAAELERL